MLAVITTRGTTYASAAEGQLPAEPGLLGAISHTIRPVCARTDSAICRRELLLSWLSCLSAEPSLTTWIEAGRQQDRLPNFRGREPPHSNSSGLRTCRLQRRSE